MSSLAYDELKLGEKAKEAYISGKSLKWIEDNCAIYLNTNVSGGIAGLHTTDLVVAGVLAGMSVLVGGQYGSGKSQLATDIYRHIFGGPKLDGGEGVIIDVNPSTEIMEATNNIYINYIGKNRDGIIAPETKLSPKVTALFHFIDEINRTPTIKQNQFYPLLNGHITHEGKKFDIGHSGYRAVMATANLGNGLYQGTFDFDPALKNRFGIVIDTNYNMFGSTEDDRGLILLLREANPGIKSAPIRDISQKIIVAHNEIKASSSALSLTEKAVLWYIEEGLRTCLKKGVDKEGELWFEECRDCSQKTDIKKPSCYFIGRPVNRTLDATRLYAASLAFLAKLKNPDVKIDGVDLMFKSFELTAAYQPFSNPDALQGYRGGFSRFMSDVVGTLKSDFNENRDYIMAFLESAEEGKTANFYKALNRTGPIKEGEIHMIQTISEEDKAKVDAEIEDRFKELKPFDEKRAIGLGWVKSRGRLMREILANRGKVSR